MTLAVKANLTQIINSVEGLKMSGSIQTVFVIWSGMLAFNLMVITLECRQKCHQIAREALTVIFKMYIKIKCFIRLKRCSFANKRSSMQRSSNDK
jgi:hypothetical protein